jgi:hypothetical protein
VFFIFIFYFCCHLEKKFVYYIIVKIKQKGETMEKYDLTFYQALEELFSRKNWIRGDGFAKGCFLKLNNGGFPVLVDVTKAKLSEELCPIYAGMVNQKYCIVTVATMKNLQ